MNIRSLRSGGAIAAFILLAASAVYSQTPDPLPSFPRTGRAFRIGLPLYGPDRVGPMSVRDARNYYDPRSMAAYVPGDVSTRGIQVLTADSAVLARYITGTDASLAAMAAEQAGRRKDARTVSALIARLSDRRSDAAASAAAGALGQIGTPDARNGLRRALSNTRPSVRQRAALALAPHGDRAAIPALREALRSGDDPYRLLAARRLATFNDRASVPGILKLADDMDISSRRFAADVLGMFKGVAAAQKRLREMTVSEKYPGTRAHAARALGTPDNRSAIPTLLKALKDRYPNVRGEAAKALSLIGDPSVIPALETAANQSAPYAVHAGGSDRLARQAAADAAHALRRPRS